MIQLTKGNKKTDFTEKENEKTEKSRLNHCESQRNSDQVHTFDQDQAKHCSLQMKLVLD